MTVHILEDDPAVRDSMSFLLQALGHVVILHGDAESFFNAPPPRRSDVVIVDLGLPGISGAQVIRWVLNLEHPPKVIAVSGQSQKLIDSELHGLDQRHILRKPLSGETLIALL